MNKWSADELRRITEADDLHISPFRNDGVTYGTPTWIWSVAVEDALYVRAYNGVKSRWYQAALQNRAGRIIAAGLTKEVTFEPAKGPINNQIDDAYRAKYHDSPYLSPMISARAGSATVMVTPREVQSRIRFLWGFSKEPTITGKTPVITLNNGVRNGGAFGLGAFRSTLQETRGLSQAPFLMGSDYYKVFGRADARVDLNNSV